jgi:hypothetical protein
MTPRDNTTQRSPHHTTRPSPARGHSAHTHTGHTARKKAAAWEGGAAARLIGGPAATTTPTPHARQDDHAVSAKKRRPTPRHAPQHAKLCCRVCGGSGEPTHRGPGLARGSVRRAWRRSTRDAHAARHDARHAATAPRTPQSPPKRHQRALAQRGRAVRKQWTAQTRRHAPNASFFRNPPPAHLAGGDVGEPGRRV